MRRRFDHVRPSLFSGTTTTSFRLSWGSFIFFSVAHHLQGDTQLILLFELLTGRSNKHKSFARCELSNFIGFEVPESFYCSFVLAFLKFSTIVECCRLSRKLSLNFKHISTAPVGVLRKNNCNSLAVIALQQSFF